MWIITAWQCISPKVIVKRQWMGLMMICCGMAVRRMGIFGVSVRKMKALTLKMETLTLIGEGR
jgi:hypothetical protein